MIPDVFMVLKPSRRHNIHVLNYVKKKKKERNSFLTFNIKMFSGFEDLVALPEQL